MKFAEASLIVVSYNMTPLRKEVMDKFIGRICEQKLDFEIVSVQLLRNGECPALFEFAQKEMKYTFIREEEENQGLWQKEALINIGIEKCETENILLFDADVYSHDIKWFDKIIERMTDHRVLQCFSLCYPDSYDNEPIFQSLGMAKSGQFDLPINHGLCHAIPRKLLEKNGGLNPYFIYGGGDSLFLREYTEEKLEWIDDYPHLKEVVRDTIQWDYNYVDTEVIHISHREGNKDYDTRHDKFAKIKKSIHDLVTIEKGLLTWKNSSSKLLKTFDKLIV
jgi:hypothetical protein